MWTKRQIIDAVIAEYRPPNFDDESSWAHFITLRVLVQLSLRRPEGRAAPYQEDDLCRRCWRVQKALREGRDPNAAYDVPLDDEAPLTYEDQLSPGYRAMAEQLNKIADQMSSRR